MVIESFLYVVGPAEIGRKLFGHRFIGLLSGAIAYIFIAHEPADYESIALLCFMAGFYGLIYFLESRRSTKLAVVSVVSLKFVFWSVAMIVIAQQ